jgi:uncharacterized protein YkwD
MTRGPARRVLSPAVALALVLALAGCISEDARPPVTQLHLYDRLDEGAQLDAGAAQNMINAYRARSGLPALTLDAELSTDARQKATDLADRDRSSWGETPKPATAGTVQATGAWREGKVSAGYRTLAEAFSGWRDQPQHNAMMLSPQAQRLGIAAVHAPASKYKVYWAMVIAAP